MCLRIKHGIFIKLFLEKVMILVCNYKNLLCTFGLSFKKLLSYQASSLLGVNSSPWSIKKLLFVTWNGKSMSCPAIGSSPAIPLFKCKAQRKKRVGGKSLFISILSRWAVSACADSAIGLFMAQHHVTYWAAHSVNGTNLVSATDTSLAWARACNV